MISKRLCFLLLTTTSYVKAAQLTDMKFSIAAKCDEDAHRIKIGSSEGLISEESSDVQRIKIAPGKHVIISVDPCDGNTSNSNSKSSSPSLLGISTSVLQNASEAGQDKPNPSSPVVEQIIVPAAIPIKLTSNS